jgi:hypothetical protein
MPDPDSPRDAPADSDDAISRDAVDEREVETRSVGWKDGGALRKWARRRSRREER